jgi:hypothetical protein
MYSQPVFASFAQSTDEMLPIHVISKTGFAGCYGSGASLTGILEEPDLIRLLTLPLLETLNEWAQ